VPVPQCGSAATGGDRCGAVADLDVHGKRTFLESAAADHLR